MPSGGIYACRQKSDSMPDMDSLPPLRALLSKYDLAPKKNLGQNFLLDLNLTSKIARQAGILQNCHVLEIGPGPGGLTRALLAQGAYVTAIERDERCLPILAEIGRHYPNHLHIIAADALHCDFPNIFAQHPFADKATQKLKIIANLPYNIGTELLLQWLLIEPWPPFYESMTLMFQKEVAERITAQSGDKSYGRLSVLANWRCETSIAMQLPPQAFTPPPKVSSAVVHLIPRENPLPCSAQALSRVTQAAFGQRRKMLRQSLKQLNLGAETPAKFLEELGIDPTKRAENLTVPDFIAIANALKQV